MGSWVLTVTALLWPDWKHNDPQSGRYSLIYQELDWGLRFRVLLPTTSSHARIMAHLQYTAKREQIRNGRKRDRSIQSRLLRANTEKIEGPISSVLFSYLENSVV